MRGLNKRKEYTQIFSLAYGPIRLLVFYLENKILFKPFLVDVFNSSLLKGDPVKYWCARRMSETKS